MIVAGLDIGTTRCKLTAFRRDGEYLGRVCREYPHTSADSMYEIDPLKLWNGVREVLAEAAASWPEIAAVGVTSFGETFVMLDEQDIPLRYAMLYTDPRGAEECEALCEMVGKENLIRITGVTPHAMYSLPKLMWVRRNQPELFRRTKRVCLIADYIVYLLTGNARIDYSLAARTLALDLHTLTWSERVFKAAGIDPRLFSSPVPTGTPAGSMLPVMAAKLGFHSAPVVVPAGHDQVAAAVGSGVFEEGMAVDGAGTVECVTPVFAKYPDPLKMAEGELCHRTPCYFGSLCQLCLFLYRRSCCAMVCPPAGGGCRAAPADTGDDVRNAVRPVLFGEADRFTGSAALCRRCHALYGQRLQSRDTRIDAGNLTA